MSGFLFGIGIGAAGDLNSIQNTLVTDCLVGITIGAEALDNQIVSNTIGCGECRELPPGVLSDFDEDFPVALADQKDICGTNFWPQNLLLTNCAEVPSFSTDQCELGQDDIPTESPSQSPAPTPLRPVPSPIAAPSPDDDNGDGGGGIACFSAMNTVEVLGKGVVGIDRLEFGDMAKVADGSRFSKVYSLAHKYDTSTTK